MTDSFEELKKYDSEDQIKNLDAWARYFGSAFKAASERTLAGKKYENVQKIAVCGMGGSGISGKILEDVFTVASPIPVKAINKYNIPKFVDETSLVIVISYSGNTEETLTAFKNSRKQKAKIIAVTSGGKLKKIATKDKISLFPIEKGYQPRFGFPLLLGTVFGALENLNLLPITFDIENLQKILAAYQETLKFSVPLKKNEAKEAASKIYDTIPFIVSNWESLAHRTKSQLNENAKMFAFGEEYPELFHNSISGWLYPLKTDISLVDLFIDVGSSYPRLQEKMKFVVEEARSFRQTIHVRFEGETFLEKFLKAIVFGDYLSYYAALLNAKDPSTIEMIKKLKTI